MPHSPHDSGTDSVRPSRIGNAARLALATFGLLALELAAIRWLSGQVRIFAYLNNLVLICVFLGMGLGVALSERRPGLRRWVLPAFLAFTGAVTAGEPFLDQLRFPDVSIHLWGAETATALGVTALSLAGVLLILGGVVGCFLAAGVAVGVYFRRLPTLRAYSFDLGGSLLGVLAFTAATALGASPPVWFLVGALPFLAIDPRPRQALALLGLVGVTWLSAGGAIYSPYNRIEITALPGGDMEISVNRDFHQYLHDLSDARLAGTEDEDAQRQRAGIRSVYDLPYDFGERKGRALIIGAGGGNDAQAALRAGFDSVYAVDIDPTILSLGAALHPERPYDDPRVVRVVDDARAFLERYDGAPFDVVSYGFLDSHAMFSSISSLRLENYVYSEEGLRAGWGQLADDGVLAVAFSVAAGPWIQDRIYWTLAAATGIEPRIVEHNLYRGSSFLLSKDPGLTFDGGGFITGQPQTSAADVRTSSDDWPFLYLRPASFPWAYVLILGCLLVAAVFLIRRVFGREVTGGGFDAPLFFMGAAFLLLETRGVTNLSLLFGSTWVVNAAVFSGILLTVLLANLFVEWRGPHRETPWFVPLMLSLALLWMVPASELAGLPILARGAVGGLLVGLPVGFAGVIVSIRLRRSAVPTAALGSNLLGAVLGGCLEYLSMAVGLQALLLLAAALYLMALATSARGVALVPIESAAPAAPPLVEAS